MKQLIIDFIDTVWNKQQFDKMVDFLSDDFTDFSLPEQLPANAQGTEAWIRNTGKSFDHKTEVEVLVAEGDMAIAKILFTATHIGEWRGLAATGIEFSATGYRTFRVENGKIAAHWGHIDATAIHNQLTNASHGCKIRQ